MNYVLIFAGGHGVRMSNASIPKQFLKVRDKPIIIHTLEIFEGIEDIEGIVIACLSDWIPEMESLVRAYGLRKVKAVIPGGKTSQMSIYNGLRCMVDDLCLPSDSVVMIHDGVRPLVSRDTVIRNLETAIQSGNAITVSPCIETIISRENGGVDILDRDKCTLARAPQTFHLADIVSYYDRSVSAGLTNFIDSATMVKHYGGEINLVVGNPENIKVTTPMDVCLFKALIDPDTEDQ